MELLDDVNIKQGTKSTKRFSNGNTLPLTQLPFGMGGFVPQTASNRGNWFFHPEDRCLEGVRYTHQPSPWIGDYGCITFMPQEGGVYASAEERWSGYRPEEAVIRPDFMKLMLLRYHAELALAPTERGGVIQLRYFGGKLPRFAIMPAIAGSSFWLADPHTVVGYTTQQGSGGAKKFQMHFVFRFSCEVLSEQTYITKSTGERERSATSKEGFDGINVALGDKEVMVRFASSYISLEQAFLNLERETATLSLAACRKNAADCWEQLLGRVRVETETEEERKTFYSCLARMFLYPNKCYEIGKNGEELHYCPHDGSIALGKMYTNNGFWDTFRTVYPFYSIVCPEIYKDILEGFVNIYRDTGWLPRWPAGGETGAMPATFIDAVIADAAVKGILDGPKLRQAFAGMCKHSKIASEDLRYGRTGIREMLEYGYVPDHIKESVNQSLDGYYCDFCIAQVAKILGEQELQNEYLERSKGYYRLFDPDSGFMRGKDTTGSFTEPFDPFAWGGVYTEGSAYQTSFAVHHDFEGLAALYGGREQLLKKLDEVFDTPPIYDVGGYGFEIHEMTEMAAVDFGQCAISNQPSFHLPYLYAYLGQPEKTAYWVRRIAKELFSSREDGFPGDEDNGTMSGWYVFTAMGFYPICPGKAEYVKGEKLLKSVAINGKELDVTKFVGNIIAHADIV